MRLPEGNLRTLGRKLRRHVVPAAIIISPSSTDDESYVRLDPPPPSPDKSGPFFPTSPQHYQTSPSRGRSPSPRRALADRSNESTAVGSSEFSQYPDLPPCGPGQPGGYRANVVAALTRAKAEVGLAPDATAEQVGNAFRKILKGSHPDSGGDLEMFRTFLSSWERAQRLFALLEAEGRNRPRTKPKTVNELHVALTNRMNDILEDGEAEPQESDQEPESESVSHLEPESVPPPDSPPTLPRHRSSPFPRSPTCIARHLSIFSSRTLPPQDTSAPSDPPPTNEDAGGWSASFLPLTPHERGRATSPLPKKRQTRTSTSPGKSWSFSHRKPPALPAPHNSPALEDPDPPSTHSMPPVCPPLSLDTTGHQGPPPDFGGEEAAMRGDVAYHRGEFGTAVELYSLALAHHPRDAGLTLSRAAAQFGRGFYSQALSDARRAARLQPGWANPFYRAGLAHKALGNYPGAVAAFRTALDLDPSPPPHLLRLQMRAEAVVGGGRGVGVLIGHGCAVGSVAIQPPPVAAPRRQKVAHSDVSLSAWSSDTWHASGGGGSEPHNSAKSPTPSPKESSGEGEGVPPLLVSGGEDGSMKVWEGGQRRCIQTLSQHTGAVTQLVWAPGGAMLASGSANHTVCLWRLGKGEANADVAQAGGWTGGRGREGQGGAGEADCREEAAASFDTWLKSGEAEDVYTICI